MKKIFDRQRYLMENVYHLGYSNEDMIDSYRTTSLALVDEIMEALHHTPWKPWSKQTSWGWEGLHEELVDVFTLLVQLCIIAGVGPEDLETWYFQKSRINEDRQKSGTYGMDSGVSRLSRHQIDALYDVAECGECTTDKVGCLLLSPTGDEVYGYNKSLDGVPCTHKPSDGCPGRTIHAEVAALAESVRSGVPVAGGAAFVTSEPCSRCLETLHAAGIMEVWTI
jgi:dUTP diphosphatase